MPRGRPRKKTTIVEPDNAIDDVVSSVTESLSSSQDGKGDGNSDTGFGIGAGGASGGVTKSDPDSDSDPGSSGEQYGIAGLNDGETDEIGDQNQRTRNVRDSVGARYAANGIGTGSGDGGRGKAGTNRRTENTQERTSSSFEPTPREVAYGSLGSKKKGSDSISEEFTTEGVALTMYGIGMLFNDIETWQVQEDDAHEFAKRIHKWLNSGGSKKANAFQKWISRNEPLLGVGIGATALIAPRVIATINKRRAIHVSVQAKSGTPGTATPAGHRPASGTTDGRGISVEGARSASNGQGSGQKGSVGNGNSASNGNARPFRNGDFLQVPEWNE